MTGVLVALFVCFGITGLGTVFGRRLLAGLDPAATLGVAGLLGLGALGTITFFVGLVPFRFGGGAWLPFLLALVGTVLLVAQKREAIRFSLPKGPELLAVLGIAVAAVIALVSVLAPSDIMDWDTLAYHLAVPKQWLAAGQIQTIPTIHQSFFPFTVDNLYIWGLQWGGQQGAKAFQLAYMLLGALAIFGLARQRYGDRAGWWAALAFATMPVVVLEAGSAYIDTAHGLYAGLGIVFAAWWFAEQERKQMLWLAAIMLGFAAGSKYTGLQTLFAVGFVLVAAGAATRQASAGLKAGVLVGIVAMAIASPWYIKNAVVAGNPVYPFFFERLGAKGWDERRADVYRNEQQSFGVGRTETRRDITQIGHAILGLAYQPGRYTNPAPTQGLGSPLAGVGVAVLSVLVLWAFSGRLTRFEGPILGVIGFSLVMWFFLTQQSRYIVTLGIPLSVLAGGAFTRLRTGAIAAGAVALQAVFTLYLFYSQRFQSQIQVVTGKVTADEYQNLTIPFYASSKAINERVKGGKVALYDEVFGFLLDVPYVWANPPHSTIIPYDAMQTGEDYVREMKRMGFTHAYISLSRVVIDREKAQTWIAAMGLQGSPVPLTPETRRDWTENFQEKWRVLLADAVAEGRLSVVDTPRSGILFQFN